MSGKRYLLTPGPTPVPPEVYAAMSEPMIAHRTAEFRAILVATLERLQQVFRTNNDVLLMTASGRPRWSPPSRTRARRATASSS